MENKQTLVEFERIFLKETAKAKQHKQETQIFKNKNLKKNFLTRKRAINKAIQEKQELTAEFKQMQEMIKKHKL